MPESIANLSPSQVVGRFSKAQRLLEEGGLPWEAWQLVIDNPKARQRLVSYWRLGCYETSTSQKFARKIMGGNFLGLEDVIKHFGASFSDDELKALAEIPFDEKTLRGCHKTHVLFPGYPLSVLEVRSKIPRGTFWSYEDAWYDSQTFSANEKVELRWYLVSRDILSGSTSKNWDEQEKLIPESWERPSAVEMAYMAALYKLTRGKDLFAKYWAWTRSQASRGGRVGVGSCGGRVDLDRWHPADHDDRLGLAVSRKFQKET